MHKIKKIFGCGKIRNKFLFISLSVGIIPLLLLGIISYIVSVNSMLKKTTVMLNGNLQMSNSMLDIQSKTVETLMRRVLDNKVITQILKEQTGDTDVVTRQTLDREFRTICSNANGIVTAYLFNCKEFRYCYRGNEDLSKLSINYQSFQNSDWYHTTETAAGKECYFLYNVIQENLVASTPSISVTKLLRDLETGEVYGVVVMNFGESFYGKIFPSEILQKNTNYFLVQFHDSDLKFLQLSKNKDSLRFTEDGVLALLHEDDSALVTTFQNYRTGWTLLCAVKKSDLLADNYVIPVFTVVCMCGLIILSAIISVISSRTITRPLARLSQEIENFTEGKTVTEAGFGNDEVGKIGRQLKKMADQNELLKNNLVRLSVMEKEAELNNLQSQINPHFLYNTLSSIYWLSKFKRSEEAAQMALSLSGIFKFALNKGGQMVPVRLEMENIKKYIDIQNLRYENRICVDWKIDENILEIPILKLLLQPLVENAIYHGLEPKDGDWNLVVSGKQENDELVFVIQDNGIGMCIEDVLAHGYGIKNVSERIRLKYGTPYGCTFESVLGVGTTVTVRLPLPEGNA
ncbi:histidine kinase [Yeguia hominis]|uniref:Sensor histidine kinase n=1 Tax=Yeguia hominis TaxID=2763662 RepID=A0A926D6J1_9FIRM|nr:sensor histidine kinase [Yeguia hominis]